jgi:hypothetical protein
MQNTHLQGFLRFFEPKPIPAVFCCLLDEGENSFHRGLIYNNAKESDAHQSEVPGFGLEISFPERDRISLL